METKLLPCWSCGGKAVPFGGAGNHAVMCDACGVTNERLIADETTYLGYEGYDTRAEAIEAWNTRHEKTCDGCKHFGMPGDYHVNPCYECVRNAPDLYEPKEATDAE